MLVPLKSSVGINVASVKACKISTIPDVSREKGVKITGRREYAINASGNPSKNLTKSIIAHFATVNLLGLISCAAIDSEVSKRMTRGNSFWIVMVL
jgi:hypothetical protein